MYDKTKYNKYSDNIIINTVSNNIYKSLRNAT